MQCNLSDDSLELFLIYDGAILKESQMHAMAQQFDHVVQQLFFALADAMMTDISISGPWDLENSRQFKRRGAPCTCSGEVLLRDV